MTCSFRDAGTTQHNRNLLCSSLPLLLDNNFKLFPSSCARRTHLTSRLPPCSPPSIQYLHPTETQTPTKIPLPSPSTSYNLLIPRRSVPVSLSIEPPSLCVDLQGLFFGRKKIVTIGGCKVTTISG